MNSARGLLLKVNIIPECDRSIAGFSSLRNATRVRLYFLGRSLPRCFRFLA
ncbi:MAG: hypothetical protein V7L23_37365 [Nostoc sp.]|uniref:hypothetical protein n=1 Tax=Nostoc sp. TaxID=1180 RepID=UPI002FF0548E